MKKLIGFLALSILLTSSAFAQWKVELPDNFPIVKEPIRILVLPEKGSDCTQAIVTAIYRPNARAEERELIGSPILDCTLAWTPKNPGITIISVMYENKEVGEKQISIPFNKTPVLGVLVLVVAGFILYGGIIYSMKVSMGQKEFE